MQSPRDILLALLNALLTFLGLPRRSAKAPRPVHGPAHPLRWAHVRRASAGATTPAVGTALPAPLARAGRPPRPALPPHLAALLAAAPAVEPEFARRPAAPVVVLAAPAPAPRRLPRLRTLFRAVATVPVRATRALDHVGRWLVRASPSRRVRAQGDWA